jgi:Bor protein
MTIHSLVRQTVLAGALMLNLAGCYTTRVHSGRTGSLPAPMATKRWHHTMVVGIAELSSVDLDALCPTGAWATIDEEQTFLNGFVAGVTHQIYTPRTYTVTCSGTGDRPAAW